MSLEHVFATTQLVCNVIHNPMPSKFVENQQKASSTFCSQSLHLGAMIVSSSPL